MATPKKRYEVVTQEGPQIVFEEKFENKRIVGVEQKYILRPVQNRCKDDIVLISEYADTPRLKSPEFVPTSEASQLIPLSPSTVRALCNSGKIDAYKDPKGHWMVSVKSLHQYRTRSKRKTTLRNRTFKQLAQN